MTQNVERIVQFLVCPQNDFMARPGEPGYPERVSMLHVGSDAVLKLRGDGRPGSRDPFVETMHRFFRDGDPGTSRLQVVIDEDWHPRHCEEFSTFGEHCVRGSPGAELPGGAQDNRYHHRCHVIRANSICIASDHHYAGVLQKACGNVRSESIRVGVFGVWTQ
ncbi:MAG: hypothetical protein FJ109_19570, partial [Deltaproteobacteria bacterium]|nr:hypothetical protein [Deltaproteobacteria bacterium]